MDERLERVYARWCARSVLHLWDAPEVVRRWVDEGSEALRDAALDAARDAAGDASGDAAWAAWAAAGEDAVENAWAARDAAGDAEGEDAAENAWVKQSRTLDLLDLLPDLLRIHGLAARLLDDVREDPWLTREVVRALALPDLAAWVDWCAAMEVE